MSDISVLSTQPKWYKNETFLPKTFLFSFFVPFWLCTEEHWSEIEKFLLVLHGLCGIFLKSLSQIINLLPPLNVCTFNMWQIAVCMSLRMLTNILIRQATDRGRWRAGTKILSWLLAWLGRPICCQNSHFIDFGWRQKSNQFCDRGISTIPENFTMIHCLIFEILPWNHQIGWREIRREIHSKNKEDRPSCGGRS